MTVEELIASWKQRLGGTTVLDGEGFGDSEIGGYLSRQINGTVISNVQIVSQEVVDAMQSVQVDSQPWKALAVFLVEIDPTEAELIGVTEDGEFV